VGWRVSEVGGLAAHQWEEYGKMMGAVGTFTANFTQTGTPAGCVIIARYHVFATLQWTAGAKMAHRVLGQGEILRRAPATEP